MFGSALTEATLCENGVRTREDESCTATVLTARRLSLAPVGRTDDAAVCCSPEGNAATLSV